MGITGRTLIIVSFLIAHLGFAQSARLKEARQLQSKGAHEEALKIIEKELISNPEDGGTWFTYSEIQLVLSEKGKSSEERLIAFKQAIKGYEKTLLYQDELTRIYAVAKTQLQELHPILLDEGIQFYSAKTYEKAVEKFSFANIAQPNDTVALIYGVSAANQGQLYEEAYSFYKKLIEIKPKSQYYQNMFVIQKERMQNPENAMSILQEAQKAFPENYSFKKYEVDLLIALDRKEEALALLNGLTEEYPNNLSLLLNKALMLDESFKQHKDELDSNHYQQELLQISKSYEEVLELSPRHPLANFNMAVLYSDQSNFLVRELNQMNAGGLITDTETYYKNIDLALEKACFYMEAAKKTQPKNLNILNALKMFYDRLEWTEKSKAIEKEIQAISG